MISDRILDVAIDTFGRCGFDGASTRDIARASATAMSSITYHFGGKEGLYLAAADRIAALIGERQRPALEEVRRTPIGDAADAVAAASALIDSFAAMMLSEDSATWARFIIREQLEPSAAFDRIWERMMRHMVEALLALIAVARADLGERERRALTVLLIGQAVVLRAGRASVCRILDVERIGAEEANLLRARLRANVRLILEETS